MSLVHHINEAEAQDAMSVIAQWIGKNYNLQVRFHNGTEVSADIFNGIINIPKLACSSGLTEEDLMLLRGRVYHEAGHISDTELDKKEYPKGVLFQILNAIEDPRMERGIGDKYPGAAIVFRACAHYYNQKIAKDVAEGKVDAPLWEGLVAMGLQSNGIAPKWRLSPKAQKYFDAGYDTFCKWKGLRNAKGSLELAKELYDILKDAHEQDKQEQQQGQEQNEEDGESQEQQQGQGQNQSQTQEDGEEQEGEQETRTGNPQDFDNEEDEQQGQGGEGQEADDEEDGEGQGGEGQEDGDEGAESDADGESGESEGDESEGGSEGDSEGEEGEDGDCPQESSSSEEGSKEYNTNYDEPNTQGGGEDAEEDDNAEEEMAEELEGGKSLDEYQNEDIAEALENLDPADKKYLSRRDLDEHEYIDGTERDKQTFIEERAQVAAAVASMVRALEQAMRARTRCRQNRFQRSGKIDKTRLTQIAKSLSKEIFYTTKKGEKIETAVEIVIDESGSMGGQEVRDVRRVAIAVSEALAQLKIPFEITGSTTKYCGGDRNVEPLNGLSRTNPIRYRHYKTFGQNWLNCRHNIAKTGSYNHNVDGEVVEYAARRLLERPEPRKVILTLSDGLPDAGHGNGAVMGQNIVRTCERARQAGVEVYAFGIGTTAPARYYGEENFVCLPTGEELGPKFAAEFVSIVSGGRFKVGA